MISIPLVFKLVFSFLVIMIYGLVSNCHSSGIQFVVIKIKSLENAINEVKAKVKGMR